MPPNSPLRNSRLLLSTTNRLVPGTLVVGGAVREEPVDDCTADREEEDEERPADLGEGWAVGFEDFHC